MEKEEIIAEMKTAIDVSIKENIAAIVGPEIASRVEKAVDNMRVESVLAGKDITGLSKEDKKAFGEDIRLIARGEKAAFLESSDQAGGYLVPEELQDGIQRIAATVGLVARDATYMPHSTETLDVPIYTGAALQGEFQGENEEGDETAADLGNVKLALKQWNVFFRLSNALIQDAKTNLSDWLLAMAAEGQAYRLDREGFVGGTFAGSPFVGLLADGSSSSVQTLGSGLTGFEDVTLEEASVAIGSIPTAALKDAAFYFHRTTWAKIRTQKSGDNYVFGQSNLASLKREDGMSPVGQILDFPVYTTDVLPAYSASAISTKFGWFGNMKLALWRGDNGPMEVAKSTEATIGGVNLFRANQTAIRLGQRLSLAQGLGAAGVALKTAAA